MICIYEEQVYTRDGSDVRRVVIHADTTPADMPKTGSGVDNLADGATIAPASLMHCADTGKNWYMNEEGNAWREDGSSNIMPAVYPHITLAMDELTIHLNATEYIYPQEMYPMDPSSLVWTTSDNEVAYLSETGTVEGTDYIPIDGRSVGTATITASFMYEGKTYSDSCVVTVTE